MKTLLKWLRCLWVSLASKESREHHHLHDRIKLKTDRYKETGVRTGDVGYIVDVYNENAYFVEFSDPETGFTTALIVVEAGDIINHPPKLP